MPVFLGIVKMRTVLTTARKKGEGKHDRGKEKLEGERGERGNVIIPQIIGSRILISEPTFIM